MRMCVLEGDGACLKKKEATPPKDDNTPKSLAAAVVIIETERERAALRVLSQHQTSADAERRRPEYKKLAARELLSGCPYMRLSNGGGDCPSLLSIKNALRKGKCEK